MNLAVAHSVRVAPSMLVADGLLWRDHRGHGERFWLTVTPYIFMNPDLGTESGNAGLF